jgi:hypothetical protein
VREGVFVGLAWHCQISCFRSRYVQHYQEMDVEPLSARALSMRLVNEFNVTLGRSVTQLVDRQAYARIGVRRIESFSENPGRRGARVLSQHILLLARNISGYHRSDQARNFLSIKSHFLW